MAIVTCHTDECGNSEEAITLALVVTDEEGTTHDVGAVVCGVCGQPITDIQDDERNQE